MNIVVVGGGLAGAKAVDELREQGYDGDVTLVGAEHHTPYERPPLSKGLLLGTDGAGRAVRPRGRRGTPTTASSCSPATPVTALDVARPHGHRG